MSLSAAQAIQLKFAEGAMQSNYGKSYDQLVAEGQKGVAFDQIKGLRDLQAKTGADDPNGTSTVGPPSAGAPPPPPQVDNTPPPIAAPTPPPPPSEPSAASSTSTAPASAATPQLVSPPPPGPGWASTGPGALNPNLGKQISRQSMQALSAGGGKGAY